MLRWLVQQRHHVCERVNRGGTQVLLSVHSTYRETPGPQDYLNINSNQDTGQKKTTKTSRPSN